MAFRLATKERVDLLNANLKSIGAEPAVYGNKLFGPRLYGALRDPAIGAYYFRGAWFTLLGAPLWPLGVYLVDDPNGPPCRFFGWLPSRSFRKIFAGGLGAFYGSALRESGRGYLLLVAAVIALLWFFD